MNSVQGDPESSLSQTTRQDDRIPSQQPDRTPQPSSIIEDHEEGRAAYRPGGFHPVYIGDVFSDRFKVLNKIGYGRYSTVWLVRDLQVSNDDPIIFRALKVLSADCYGHGNDTFEREILTHLRDGDRRQMGYAYVCHLITGFKHQGPNGTHTCLVFELMGETLRTFGAWFPESMLPYSVMRRFAIQLLYDGRLDDDRLVFTLFWQLTKFVWIDIKPDNIFVKFRDYSRIDSNYLSRVPVPQQDREESDYSPIPSQPLRNYYFSEEDSTHVDEFDIALGDWGVSSWTTKHLSELIQPVTLRSPEVLIEAPWDASTDWWNLGAVLLELYRAVRMFSGRVPPDGQYQIKRHLTEIIDLFGPFPKALLEKGNQDLVRGLFNNEGHIKDAEPLNRPSLSSEAFMPGLSQEKRADFVSFLELLMKIDPEQRPSTMDLLRHPWLGAVA